MKTSALVRKTPMVRKAIIQSEPKPAPGQRKRSCKACKTKFQPFRSFEAWCSPECGAIVAKERLAAQERKADKERKQSMQPARWWRKKCKTALHEFVRARDEGQQCASCDTVLVKLGRIGGDYDAGHFRSVATAKHLEFDIRNIWGQCKYCNDRLRGNYQEYERRLRLKKGDAFVDDLMADQRSRHMKICDYQELEAWAKSELKKLKDKS